MQDRKMEDNIWGKVRRWKMRDRKMEEQIWGQARRWKMQDQKMEDQKMEDRKVQDQVLAWKMQEMSVISDRNAVKSGLKLFTCKKTPLS